jgi:hypothetical protein
MQLALEGPPPSLIGYVVILSISWVFGTALQAIVQDM